MKPADDPFIRNLTRSFWSLAGLIAVAAVLLSIVLTHHWRMAHPLSIGRVELAVRAPKDTNFVNLWTPPSDWRLMRLTAQEQAQVRYGRELIAHTADYLGPKGSVMGVFLPNGRIYTVSNYLFRCNLIISFLTQHISKRNSFMMG